MGESLLIKDPGCFAWRQPRKAISKWGLKKTPNISSNLPSLSFCCDSSYDYSKLDGWKARDVQLDLIFPSYHFNTVKSAQLLCVFFFFLCVFFIVVQQWRGSVVYLFVAVRQHMWEKDCWIKQGSLEKNTGMFKVIIAIGCVHVFSSLTTIFSHPWLVHTELF